MSEAAGILIVEDHELNYELVHDLLLAAGYRVERAVDGRETLAKLKVFKPDLILMDLQLPDTDGYSLTGTIRNLPGFAAVPIVALTAFAMQGDREKALAAGCTGFISKPINTRAFVADIRNYLSREP